LQVSIDFSLNGDARLCSGLLKQAIFKGKKSKRLTIIAKNKNKKISSEFRHPVSP